MTALHRPPRFDLRLAPFILLGGMPAYRCRIEEHLCAKERRNPCGLRIPLVPADEDADGGVARFPDLESVGFTRTLAVVIKMAIARREVILLVIERIVRNV